jgi:hypothetical protein
MGRSWESAIKQAGELTIARAANAPGWATAFATAVVRFNDLSNSLSLGVTFRDIGPKNLKSANVEFATADGKVSFGFGGANGTTTLAGNAKKGLTQPIANGNGELVKQFIFVPAKTQHDFLKICMVVHEMIHATGLDNSDHSSDADPDVFCSSLTPSGKGVQAGLFANRIMPPLWMTFRTAAKVQALW